MQVHDEDYVLVSLHEFDPCTVKYAIILEL